MPVVLVAKTPVQAKSVGVVLQAKATVTAVTLDERSAIDVAYLTKYVSDGYLQEKLL